MGVQIPSFRPNGVFIMSKSYKKHPFYKYKNKGMKQIANRKIRRNNNDIPSGKSYKKYFCSYDICDYVSYQSFSEFIKSYKKYHRDIKSIKELYRKWYRFYRMK